MADEANQMDGFEPVEVQFNVNGGSRREPPTFVVEKTGYGESNVAAAELMLPHIVQAGEYPEQFTVALRVGKVNGLVKVQVAKHGQKNTVPARLSKDRRKISFHLGPVFQKHPQLAPTSTRKCPFRQEADGSLVIALASGVTRRSTTRPAPRRVVCAPGASCRYGACSRLANSGEMAQSRFWAVRYRT